MKQLLSFLLLGLFSFSWAQKIDKFPFEYSSERMEKVLVDVENKFKIKYSYLDSIVAQKKITLPKRKYSLKEINESIELQTSLKITQIDNRFYTISKEQDSIKNYQLKEIIIEGFVAQGINKTNEKFIIYPQKVETLPGVTDADILLSLQQLPGVKSPNETATGLHVRGGTSDQNLILWDGIRLYHPGHLFGMISGINPNVNQTVNYYNKSTNPKFGERISSVIDIKTSDVITDKVKGKVGVNALNADLYFQIPIVKKKLGLQLSGRKSFTEWWQSPTFNQLADKVFQNTNFSDFDNQNQFEFEDYSAKINYIPSSKTSFSITGIVIDNNLNFINEVPNYSINNQKMNIINYGYSFNWTQKYSDTFTQKMLLFYSSYDFDYEKRQQFSTTQFEAYKKLNRIVDSGAELNFTKAFSEDLSFDFGYQLFGNDASHLFSSFNQDIGLDLSLMQLNTVNHIGYSFLKYKISDWDLHAGARYNWYGKLRTGSFEPRIFIQNKLTDSFIWQTTFERKSQILSQVRENEANDLSLENYVWVISKTKDSPIQTGNQFTTGFIFKKDSWVVDLDLYYKTIKGITTFSFGFSNQFDTAVRLGNGFTKGIDVLVQKSAPTWRAWMTYTYQDSQNRFEDVNQYNYFQINSNVKHAFNASFNKKWKLFSVALGWFIHSGKPFSSLNDDNQIATFNSERLPIYHRLDVSAIYQLHETKSTHLKVGLSLYNLYNRKSVISKELERRYEDIADYSVPKYNIQDYYSLGITPNLFFRFTF
jgi:TonB-dependent Receptor Plug Domain